MSSSTTNDNTRLIVTATAAAVAGAALGIGVLKLFESNNKKSIQESYYSNNSVNNNTNISRSTSVVRIMEDTTKDLDKLRMLNDDSMQGTNDNTTNTLVFPHNHEEKMRRKIAARVAVEEDNYLPRESVTVRVPATSANMGPGYDTIGMAVDLWSEVTVCRSDKFEITGEGEGADDMPKDESNYLVLGCKKAFEAANKPMPILKYHVVSRIPYARGLGSSSAAIVAGIIAGLVLAGHRLPCWGSEALLQIAAGIEGHPDNVSPVIYGGIQIGIHNGTRWETERVPIPPGMQLVMFIPDFIGKTSDARGVLEETISRTDCAFNISRIAFLVHALCMGNLDNLKYGVQDKIHQPQRGGKLYHYLFPMIESAQKAGAACAYLSGAGPTVMAITTGASGDIFAQRARERSDVAVARAMIQTAEEYNISGKILISSVCNEGARVVKVTPPFSTDAIAFRDNL